MRQALSKAAIETEITSRFHSAFKPRAKASAEVISAGVTEVDALTGGLPRGAITEIFGPASSGRTSLMLAALAHASTHDEVCALVDTSNTFDPVSAANAQMDLDRLLWVRCDGKLEHAFKAADLLLQGGGFGLVVLDLGDVPAPEARRIISSWWYRFRRVVENKPTALVVIAADSCVRSCASMTLEIGRESAAWASMIEPAAASAKPLAANPPQQIAAFKSRSSAVPELPIPHTKSMQLPTHSMLLRGTYLHLECLKPVQFAKDSARFKSNLTS